MSKLHIINEKYFKMSDSMEVFCQFGMSILCRVETGWGKIGDPVGFYYKGQKLSGPETHVGDAIFMDHDGPHTSWIIAKKPRDPRLSLLWEFGYRSATRIRVAEPSADAVLHELRVRAGFEYADDPTDDNWAWKEPIIERPSKKPVIIKDAKGNVLVALYAGYVGSGRTYCYWFMREDASLADIKSALLASSESNKRHPLLQ